MSHEDLLKAVIYVIHGKYTPFTDETRYHVPNRNTLQVKTTLESIQEQQDNHLLESYNQKQIFRWFRNHLKLTSIQGHGYTEWEICEACERRILINSSYFETFGVPKSTLCRSLNVILPLLKCSSLNHLWYIIISGKITKKTVR